MSKSGGIAYLLKHGRAPFPVTTRTQQPRAKGVKRMADGGAAAERTNAYLNYPGVPNYDYEPSTNIAPQLVLQPDGTVKFVPGKYQSGTYTGGSNRPTTGGPAGAGAGAGTGANSGGSSGRDGGERDRTPGWYETTTPAERAAFFAANPTLAGISRFGIEMFGKLNPYGLASLQEKLNPGMRQGYLAETYGLAGDRMADINREAEAYARDYQAGTGVNQGMSLGDQYSSYGAGRAAAESYVSPSMGSAAGNGGMNDAETSNDAGNDTAPDGSYGGPDRGDLFAAGGITALARGGQPQHPRLLSGGGDGLSDDIPAVIGNDQPARLADGEFVVSADVVSALGGGSTKAGAKKLYAMMDRIRKQAHGTKKQVKKVNERKVLPA